MGKLLSFEKLTDTIDKKHELKKKLVLCHGCFDLLHIGHIKHLQEAKEYGDILVVTITPDRFVNKGYNRPFFNEKLRAEAVASLECVDFVSINKWNSAVETIKILKPDFFVKDIEYKDAENNGFQKEVDAIKSINGEIKFTNEIKFSSSSILNNIVYSQDVINFIKKLKEKYTCDDLLKYIEKIKNLNVLVIGELVIDKYCFGVHRGKMRKESIIEFMVDSKKNFLGGSGIVANHISNFSDNVTLLTLLGANNPQEKFIDSNLNKKIRKIFFTKKDSPTPVKRRYVEEKVGYRNLFKVSEINDYPIDGETSEKISKKLKEILPNYDLVVVTDYGHGMIDINIMWTLVNNSKYLAVNTQINTENMGYNTIDKYHRINFACINEAELRLVEKDKYRKVEDLMYFLWNDENINTLLITRGYQGCMIYDGDKIIDSPAICTNPVDIMGSGDALFAITSILSCINVPMDITSFMGNIAGSMHSNIIGNEKSIDKGELCQMIRILMK